MPLPTLDHANMTRAELARAHDLAIAQWCGAALAFMRSPAYEDDGACRKSNPLALAMDTAVQRVLAISDERKRRRAQHPASRRVRDAA